MLLNGFRSLDRILRGDATRPGQLDGGTVDAPPAALSVVILLLAAVYGLCMGAFALVSRWGTPRLHEGFLQVLSSGAKVPALLVLTLLVTGPSLYVFNALLGSRLSLTALLRLLTASAGVLAAVLAGFSTILVFFSLCTDSYPFIILLNVTLFAVAGCLGLGFLLQTLHRLAAAAMAAAAADRSSDDPAAPLPLAGDPPGPLDRLRDYRELQSVRRVFRIWVVVFGLVGAPMSWVLRPFVLNPHDDFAVFRHRESNFFAFVFGKVGDLFHEQTTGTNGGDR